MHFLNFNYKIDNGRMVEMQTFNCEKNHRNKMSTMFSTNFNPNFTALQMDGPDLVHTAVKILVLSHEAIYWILKFKKKMSKCIAHFVRNQLYLAK